MKWLIKFFNGYTKEEYKNLKDNNSKVLIAQDILNKENYELTKSNNSLKKTNAKLTLSLKSEKDKIKNLKQENINESIELKNKLIKSNKKKMNDLNLQFEKKMNQSSLIGSRGERLVRDILIKIFPNDLIFETNIKKNELNITQTIINNKKSKLCKLFYQVNNLKFWDQNKYDIFLNAINKKNIEENIRFNIFITKNSSLALLSSNQYSNDNKHINKINHNLFYDSLSNIYIAEFSNFPALIQIIRAIVLENKFINDKNDLVENQIGQRLRSKEFLEKSNQINNIFKMTGKHISEAIKKLSE